MPRIFFLSVLVLVSSVAFSQSTIKLEEVKDHIGDSVTVCGKVYSARYFESSSNSPTFLNIGANYPNQLLTVVIWGDVRKQFDGKPEELFKDKEICISGKIELYREKPQIVIRESKQIEIKR